MGLGIRIWSPRVVAGPPERLPGPGGQTVRRTEFVDDETELLARGPSVLATDDAEPLAIEDVAPQ